MHALHQAIQRWAKLTLPVQKKPHITTPPPTHTKYRSMLSPMHRPNKDQPQDVPPRVVIQKSNASPVPTQVPSAKINYEPIARRTSSRVPRTVDQPPPRVRKTQDIGPISRCTRSQTTVVANVITPDQAEKLRYPAQFFQSLAIPVLDKTSGKSLQYLKLRNSPSLRTYGTLPMLMNLVDYAK